MFCAVTGGRRVEATACAGKSLSLCCVHGFVLPKAQRALGVCVKYDVPVSCVGGIGGSVECNALVCLADDLARPSCRWPCVTVGRRAVDADACCAHGAAALTSSQTVLVLLSSCPLLLCPCSLPRRR